MTDRRILDDLFRGEGALPEPSPEERRELEGLLDSFADLATPPAGERVRRSMDDYLDAHRRTAGLFGGEEAQPRPTPEEEDELDRTLVAFKKLSAPPAGPGVRAGVRDYLDARKRARQVVDDLEEGAADPELVHTVARFRTLQAPPASAGIRHRVRRYLMNRKRLRRPTPGPGWIPVVEDLRQAIGESRLLKGLAAGLLIQALALPVTAAYTALQSLRKDRPVVEAPPLPLPSDEPLEPIRPPANPGGPDTIALEVPGSATTTGSANAPSLALENSLRLRWQALAERVRPAIRLQRLRRLGGPLAVNHQVDRWSREVAAALETTEDPYTLALGIRSLVLAGNTVRVGPHAPALRRAVPRLRRSWETAEALPRIQIAAALTELNILTGGAEKAATIKALDWCLDWTATPANLAQAPSWALADLAEVLEWTPLLLPRLAHSQRLLLQRELEGRTAPGGTTGEDAAAALLRAFPNSTLRDEALRLTLFLRRDPLEKASTEPWTLVHLAWGLFPPSGEWADFNLELRSAAYSIKPRTLRERALWVMALTVFYSAPEEHSL